MQASGRTSPTTVTPLHGVRPAASPSRDSSTAGLEASQDQPRQGNCSVRVPVGTEPPMFTRMRSRSLPPPAYFTAPFMFTSSSK